MNKTVEGRLLDIAAELIVSPITAYVKVHEIKETVTGSEAYSKTAQGIRYAGSEVKNAAKRAYENEHVQRGINAVKDTAKKVCESESALKARESLEKAREAAAEGREKAAEGIRSAAAKFGFASENEEGCRGMQPLEEGFDGDYTEVNEEGESCCGSTGSGEEGCCEASQEPSAENMKVECAQSGAQQECGCSGETPESASGAPEADAQSCDAETAAQEGTSENAADSGIPGNAAPGCCAAPEEENVPDGGALQEQSVPDVGALQDVNSPCCEKNEEPAVSEETIVDVIEAVDLSDIITEDDAKADIPE